MSEDDDEYDSDYINDFPIVANAIGLGKRMIRDFADDKIPTTQIFCMMVSKDDPESIHVLCAPTQVMEDISPLREPLNERGFENAINLLFASDTHTAKEGIPQVYIDALEAGLPVASLPPKYRGDALVVVHKHKPEYGDSQTNVLLFPYSISDGKVTWEPAVIADFDTTSKGSMLGDFLGLFEEMG